MLRGSCVYISGWVKRRLVALVVAEAAIAEHVDDDGLVELLPELGRDLGGEDDRFRIVAVHVEDRRLDHLRDVGRIGRGAREARIGREADLVVDDEVDRAAGAVALQARQAEAFGDDALAGEGRIAMDQQRHHRASAPTTSPMLVLLGAHLAEHDGIDDLEMRRVGGQRQVDVVAVERRGRDEAPRWYFTSPEPSTSSGAKEPPLNSWKSARCGLPITCVEHVQAAAMGHAEHDLLARRVRRRA